MFSLRSLVHLPLKSAVGNHFDFFVAFNFVDISNALRPLLHTFDDMDSIFEAFIELDGLIWIFASKEQVAIIRKAEKTTSLGLLM